MRCGFFFKSLTTFCGLNPCYLGYCKVKIEISFGRREQHAITTVGYKIKKITTGTIYIPEPVS